MRCQWWRCLRRALVLSLLLVHGNVLGTTACNYLTDPECSGLLEPCGAFAGSCCSGLVCNCHGDFDPDDWTCKCTQAD